MIPFLLSPSVQRLLTYGMCGVFKSIWKTEMQTIFSVDQFTFSFLAMDSSSDNPNKFSSTDWKPSFSKSLIVVSEFTSRQERKQKQPGWSSRVSLLLQSLAPSVPSEFVLGHVAAAAALLACFHWRIGS